MGYIGEKGLDELVNHRDSKREICDLRVRQRERNRENSWLFRLTFRKQSEYDDAFARGNE